VTRLARLVPDEPWLRWVLGALVGVLAYVLVTAGVAALFPGPSGPTASVYATAPGGVAAYGELLANAGHRVLPLRRAPSAARLPSNGTLFVLDPSTIAPWDVAALGRFVRGGGYLVVGGEFSGISLSRLLAGVPTWSAGGPDADRVVRRAPEDAGVTRVLTAGDGEWTSARRTTPLLAAAGGDELVTARLGRGRIDLLADVAPLENQLLGDADDAQLALDLAGPSTRPVLFLETIHGYGAGSGLGALPGRWRWALLGALLAAIVFALAHARRLGAADPEPPPRTPERALYVHSLAATLSRTHGAHAAADPVRLEALAIHRRLGGRPGEDDDARRGALAARAEVELADLDALLSIPHDDQSVLRSGRALARLRRLRR
jgi:hypothetical protein